MTNLNAFGLINDKREDALVTHFKRNIGRRVFILTEAFPFMFIGEIKGVMEDIVALDVETTSVPALEGKEWKVHIDSIDVFYIETGIGAKIPHLKDNSVEDAT
ncbi:hypothetical protein [Paenisporosarcina sp. TG20]|uniref:hypothetical protein n=1 Tax=Paenisporosarcina sp. TG20 TaxID=1211706 RepID=UPI0002E9D008|nr:hypothetical protein [Paenisporosarcina sp. TG20]